MDFEGISELQFKINQDYFKRGYSIFGFNKTHYVGALTLIQSQENESFDPLFTLSKNQAQGLMNELWNAGIRPTDDVDNKGELKATKMHLEDMRKIASKYVKVNL
jgi:hypothetical protein